MNRFKKVDDKWYVEGPCIDKGECIGDYVDVTKKDGDVKEVLIASIVTRDYRDPFSKQVVKKRYGIPMSKKESAEYCGYDEDDYEESYLRYDRAY